MIVVLFLSNSIYLQSQNTFSKEELAKIANIIFEKEYCDSMSISLFNENRVLAEDRDNAYAGLKYTQEMIVVKDSMQTSYKTELINCDSTNNAVIKENKNLKDTNKKLTWIGIGEGIGIIILTLILL